MAAGVAAPTSTGGAKIWVLVAYGLMLAYIAIDAKSNPAQAGVAYKRVWGSSAVALGLALVADVLPELAGPFAIVVVLGLYARHQGKLGGAISEATGQKTSTPATTKKG